MDNLKVRLRQVSHIEEITDYIDEKYNEVKNLVKEVDEKYQDIQARVQDIQDIASSIDGKLTEDTVDRLNNLGTYEDFVQGFNDGLAG